MVKCDTKRWEGDTLKEVIKSIIKIDKDAIKKEDDFKSTIEDLEKQKRFKLKELKDKVELDSKNIIEEYQTRVLKEAEIEINQIREDAKQKSEELKERYIQFEEKFIENSFNMIIRNLEE